MLSTNDQTLTRVATNLFSRITEYGSQFGDATWEEDIADALEVGHTVNIRFAGGDRYTDENSYTRVDHFRMGSDEVEVFATMVRMLRDEEDAQWWDAEAALFAEATRRARKEAA